MQNSGVFSYIFSTPQLTRGTPWRRRRNKNLGIRERNSNRNPHFRPLFRNFRNFWLLGRPRLSPSQNKIPVIKVWTCWVCSWIPHARKVFWIKLSHVYFSHRKGRKRSPFNMFANMPMVLSGFWYLLFLVDNFNAVVCEVSMFGGTTAVIIPRWSFLSTGTSPE